MKRFAKIAALLLALVLSVGMFAGCTTGNKDDDMKELVIGITYFAPMNYKEGDKLVGFETEFAEAVCAKIGMKPKFQVIKWASKENELNANTIDCIWNGMTVNEDLKKTMLISTEYMRNKQVAVVLKENAEKYANLDSLDGVTVVAEKESAGEAVAKENELFKNASYTAVETQSAALQEIKAKTAEIAIVDYVMSIGSIGEGTSYEDLVVIDKEFSPETYGIAFKKGNTELCDKVNKAMQELADEGKLAEIATKYKLQDLILVKPSK